MITAAIDIGSNTLRLLIGEMKADELPCLYTARSVTRLAAGITETGLLNEDNMQQSLAALKDFSLEIARHGVKHVRAVGTSALREAQNSKSFIDKAFVETGLQIEIISGEEEARLTAKGVMLGYKDIVGSPLIIDIGGGSTEWLIQPERSNKALYHGSVPVGVVNLSERFIKTDPPAAADIKRLLDEIDSGFDSVKYDILNNIYTNARLISTGGTTTTLAAMDLGLKEYSPEKIHMHNISMGRLCQLRDRLISMPLSQRQGIEGLEAKRADLIIPGILLTIRIMELFGFDEIIVSDYGMLEGIIAG